MSYDLLKQLKRREHGSTTVETAHKIARYFGVSLDQFLEDPTLKDPIEIVTLYYQLPPELRERVFGYAQAQLDAHHEATSREDAEDE